MAGKASSKRGFGKKLKDQQVTNKELYNIAGGVPTQASSSIVSAGSQGGGTYQNNQSADINMNTYDIVDVDRLKFALKLGAGDQLTNEDYGIEGLYFGGTDAYGVQYRVPAEKQHIFMQGDDIVFSIHTTGVAVFGGDIEVTGFEDMYKMAEPASPPSGFRRIFLDDGVSGHLSVKRADGTVIDLETSGWSGSATSDLDMNTYDIIDVDRLQFTSDSGEGRDNTKIEMYANANPDAVFNHPASSKIRFTENGNQYLTFDEDSILPHVDSNSAGTTGVNIGSATKRPYAVNSRTINIYGGGAGIGSTLIGLNFSNNAGVSCGGVGGKFTSIWNGLEDLGTSSNYWKDLYIAEIQMKDTSADPTTNGQFTRNGNDVKVYTGGAVKSLSDIGSGGGGGSPFAESLLPTDTDTYDLGSSAKQWQNLYIDGVAVVDQISCSGQIDGGGITASGALYGGTTLTAVGATYLNGAVTLGDASGDDINVKGKLDFINNFSTQYYASHPAVTGYITVNTPDGSKNLWFS